MSTVVVPAECSGGSEAQVEGEVKIYHVSIHDSVQHLKHATFQCVGSSVMGTVISRYTPSYVDYKIYIDSTIKYVDWMNLY